MIRLERFQIVKLFSSLKLNFIDTIARWNREVLLTILTLILGPWESNLLNLTGSSSRWSYDCQYSWVVFQLWTFWSELWCWKQQLLPVEFMESRDVTNFNRVEALFKSIRNPKMFFIVETVGCWVLGTPSVFLLRSHQQEARSIWSRSCNYFLLILDYTSLFSLGLFRRFECRQLKKPCACAVWCIEVRKCCC